MATLPTDGLGLIALVFLLGLKHGFDPDHLVAIDGLTRSRGSRWCGLFFSLGHGAVVTLVASAVAIFARDWQAPGWLGELGAWISIGVLLVLGIANLLMVFRTPAGRPVSLLGVRGRWLVERLAQATHPAVIASVGAAFALSFDTLSHALLFSFTGWVFAAVLGLVFTLGMVVTDALNGLWVARLIGSRCMSAAIALLCLAIGATGLAKYGAPVSVATLLVIGATYAACRLARRASIPFRI
jgi:nickel/cobalt transporter (NiCoT) family protein